MDRTRAYTTWAHLAPLDLVLVLLALGHDLQHERVNLVGKLCLQVEAGAAVSN
jgi:hypothetical protein